MSDKNLTTDLALHFGTDLNLAEGFVVRPINFPTESPPLLSSLQYLSFNLIAPRRLIIMRKQKCGLSSME